MYKHDTFIEHNKLIYFKDIVSGVKSFRYKLNKGTSFIAHAHGIFKNSLKIYLFFFNQSSNI